MVGHGGSSAGSYLADPTSPIPSHCASIVVTSTLRVNPGNLGSLRVLLALISTLESADHDLTLWVLAMERSGSHSHPCLWECQVH